MVAQLKQEIYALFELQNDGLKGATYLGMTPDEAKVVTERRKNISTLVDQLAKIWTIISIAEMGNLLEKLTHERPGKTKPTLLRLRQK